MSQSVGGLIGSALLGHVPDLARKVSFARAGAVDRRERSARDRAPAGRGGRIERRGGRSDLARRKRGPAYSRSRSRARPTSSPTTTCSCWSACSPSWRSSGDLHPLVDLAARRDLPCRPSAAATAGRRGGRGKSHRQREAHDMNDTTNSRTPPRRARASCCAGAACRGRARPAGGRRRAVRRR